MEHPGKEIADVVRALVNKPTFKQQAEAVEKYFCTDATFCHGYLNVARGHPSLVAVYQFAMFLANYQEVLIRSVVYNSRTNCVAIRMTVICKPWILLWRNFTLELFTHVELQESTEKTANGKTIKKIKLQKDYFFRDPLIQLIPIVGPIYNSDAVRFAIGDILTQSWRIVKSAYFTLVPEPLQECVFSFWEKHLLAPPTEQLQSLKAQFT